MFSGEKLAVTVTEYAMYFTSQLSLTFSWFSCLHFVIWQFKYDVLRCALEKAMAPHSSTLAWKIPWMEEPGGLQSMGSRRVRHDWKASLSLFTFCIGEGNGNPLQCSCLENPREGGAWWAAVYGVAQSRTRLKRLSSSSSKIQEFKFIKSSFWKHLSEAPFFQFS